MEEISQQEWSGPESKKPTILHVFCNKDRRVGKSPQGDGCLNGKTREIEERRTGGYELKGAILTWYCAGTALLRQTSALAIVL